MQTVIISVGEALELFIKNCKSFYEEGTLEGYVRYTKELFSYCPKEIADMKREDIKAWLADAQKKGASPRSLHVRIAAVRSFFAECKDKNLVIINPTTKLKRPKLEELLPKPVNELSTFKIKEAAKNHPRDRAIISTLDSSGIRVSELVNIKITDVWWDSREIWIRKGKGLKERYAILTPPCIELLKRYLAIREDNCPYLFINHRKQKLTRQGIWKILKHYSEKAGLEKNITPHQFRHAFITELFDNGAKSPDVADLAGITNLDTLKGYKKSSIAKNRAEFDKLR